jgi:KaiC/GvpD/RAD55 family RecA-like ATPase
MSSAEKRISLGYPLDLLLNRECKFVDYDKSITKSFVSFPENNNKRPGWGSVILPREDNPGTGNIIIRGKPGTAKSTLAMQFAVSAAQKGNDCISFYITLEERPENIFHKTKPFGWDSYCSIFNQLCGLESSSSADEFKEYLEKGMTQNNESCRFHINDKSTKNCSEHKPKGIESRVFISTLTPRNIFHSDSKEFNLFWDRYEQLDRLLAAADAYNRKDPKKDDIDAADVDNKKNEDKTVEGKTPKPKISFIVIDSINVFGDSLLSRSELFRIFDLFKKYQIIGIFIVEEDEKYIFQHDNKLHGETLEYIGDVIISLTTEEDQDYAIRYFEITKSRYQHQVYGKHPFKIMESIITPEIPKEFFDGKKTNELFTSQSYNRLWAIKGIEEYKLLPDHLTIDPCEIIFQSNFLNEYKFQFRIEIDIINNTIRVKNKKEKPLLKTTKTGEKEEVKNLIRFNKGDCSVEAEKKQANDTKVLIIRLVYPVFAVKVFPSLHYIVYGTNVIEKEETEQDNDENQVAFCDTNANLYLSREQKGTGSLLIEGPRDTFKTSLARDFLMKGIFGNNDENENKGDVHVLFIRLLDYYSDGNKLKAFRISEACSEIIMKEDATDYKAFISNRSIVKFWETDKEATLFWEGLKLDGSEPIISTKMFLCSYKTEVKGAEKRFTELIFQSGYILPEEFIQILLETIQKYDDKKLMRIVIDEIGRMGSRYPLLFKSKTAGEMFLTALFHIIRNYKIKLLITGTRDEYEKSDDIIEKVRTLVDDILITKKINVFGDNFVTIQGGSLTSSENLSYEEDYCFENIPGVIIPRGKFLFKVDKEKFIGLVGFDTDKIYRPGIDFYLFRESFLHRKYNEELAKLLKFAFSHWGNGIINDDQEIQTYSYDGTDTTSFHDSLGMLRGKPIKKTVICTIDEFYIEKDETVIKETFIPIDDTLVEKLFINKNTEILNNDPKTIEKQKYSLPYYDNVLLLVYNSDYIQDSKNFAITGWINLLDELKKLLAQNPELIGIDFISETDETLSCLLLDAIYSSIINSGNEDLKKELSDRVSSNTKSKRIKIDKLIEKLLAYEKLNSNSIGVRKPTLKENLGALYEIIRMSKKSYYWRGIEEVAIQKYDLYESAIAEKDNKYNEINKKYIDVNGKIFKDKIKGEKLYPDSVFYICWYSQLRELIDCYPGLASKLKVFSLPGGGFTGDWRIALLKGSVSINLGNEVLKFLCSENEDYKRFVRGIGLPTKERFYFRNKPDYEEIIRNTTNKLKKEKVKDSEINIIIEKDKKFHSEIETNREIANKKNISARFMAWPGSKLHVDINEFENKELSEMLEADRIPQLFKLFNIHDKAHKRSNIKDYLAIRESLVTLFKQLICLDSEDKIESAIIERMPGIIRRFSSEEDEPYNQHDKE